MRGTKLVVEVLFHIVKYCEKLTYNVRLVEGDYDKFIDRENRMLLDVSSFYVLQIGELVNKLTKEFRAEHADMPWREIVNMRNKLVHGYEQLKREILWNTMVEDIPKLNEQCRSILRELDPTAEADIRAELEEETTIYG